MTDTQAPSAAQCTYTDWPANGPEVRCPLMQPCPTHAALDIPPLMGAGQPLVLSWGLVDDDEAGLGEAWRLNLEAETLGWHAAHNVELTDDEVDKAQSWAAAALAAHTDFRVRRWTVEAQPSGQIFYVATLDRVATHLTIFTESGRTYRLWNLYPHPANVILTKIGSGAGLIEIPEANVIDIDDDPAEVAPAQQPGQSPIPDTALTLFVPTLKIESVVRVVGPVPYEP